VAERVTAGGKFKLIGTDNQVLILLPVFEGAHAMTFPWARITALPRFPVPISWDDLNDGTLRTTHVPETVRAHGEPTPADGQPVFPRVHGDGKDGHAISRPGAYLGMPEKRLAIAGVFWTDGRIKIDVRMEARPADAREVLSAELAHAIDYGLPYTDAMKGKITTLFHPGGADAHTWWERSDYGAEYYTLVGEANMALITHAYSDMTPWQDPFTHKSSKDMAARVHAILGCPPTTGTAPTPTTGGMRVYQIRGYKKVHRNASTSSTKDDCYTVRRARGQGRTVTNGGLIVHSSVDAARVRGLTPCLICKPT
jgi:hypothetical protein